VPDADPADAGSADEYAGATDGDADSADEYAGASDEYADEHTDEHAHEYADEYAYSSDGDEYAGSDGHADA
jgi:hypothetical protein